MSKSLGNFFTAREVMAKIKHPEVLRFFLLSSQYRGPMNYSPDQLDQAEAALTRMYLALREHAVEQRRPVRADAATVNSSPPWTTISILPKPLRCCKVWRVT